MSYSQKIFTHLSPNNSANSNCGMLCVQKGTPSAPNMLKILSMSRNSVSLEWYAPFSDGGCEITNYVILKKQVPIDIWEEVGTVNARSTSYTVQGLREGKAHFFAVYAVNKQGRGDQIETTKAIMPKRAVCE